MTITTRFSEEADEKRLVEWLLQPGIMHWFPLADLREVEDAARIWMSYIKMKGVLTALWDGTPCGTALLYLSPYKKMAHQCLFAIIVDEKFRGKKVGTQLLTDLISLAQETHHIELLHLEVYEGNPATRLYERLGFVEYGRERHFIKEGKDHYLTKVMMQKVLS